jgi:sporadic carbohydrate cluster protein (TIGR04323 family)|tara:strand:+ start:3156 stop:3560 length:405 start_codon:yes stop_codon:yes gene_type:complete
MKNTVRGYIFSRPFMGERVPQSVQNIVIRDYCQKNNLHYLLSHVEYVMPFSSVILEQALSELDSNDGIIAYSLFQLPEKISERREVYKKIYKKSKVIFFALENIRASNHEDFERIENIWMIRDVIPRCLKSLPL